MFIGAKANAAGRCRETAATSDDPPVSNILHVADTPSSINVPEEPEHVRHFHVSFHTDLEHVKSDNSQTQDVSDGVELTTVASNEEETCEGEHVLPTPLVDGIVPNDDLASQESKSSVPPLVESNTTAIALKVASNLAPIDLPYATIDKVRCLA